jgi:hypothetical protein
MRKKPSAIIGPTLAAVWLLTLPTAAVEFRFQGTNLDDLTFTSDLEPDSPARHGEKAMGRLETRLDTMAFPAGRVLPGRQVPDVSSDFLANAVGQGTFTRWLEQNAKSLNGMFIVVGRGRGWIYDQDRVYVVLKLPPEPHTFKLVIGWRDRLRPAGSSPHHCKHNGEGK